MIKSPDSDEKTVFYYFNLFKKFRRSFSKSAPTLFAVSLTSSWERGCFDIPAARFEIQLIPQIFIPAWFAAIASQAVLIPTASAPSVLYICISAQDS